MQHRDFPIHPGLTNSGFSKEYTERGQQGNSISEAVVKLCNI